MYVVRRTNKDSHAATQIQTNYSAKYYVYCLCIWFVGLIFEPSCSKCVVYILLCICSQVFHGGAYLRYGSPGPNNLCWNDTLCRCRRYKAFRGPGACKKKLKFEFSIAANALKLSFLLSPR